MTCAPEETRSPWSWAAILRRYDHKHRPRALRELDWFRSQPSLENAVENAALARDHRGKRYNHQTRLRRVSLAEGHRQLLSRSAALRQARSFDALFLLVTDVAAGVRGLDEVWSYDAALRIGAYLGVLPERVYLHAGTRVGAGRLGLDRRAVSVPVSDLPVPLRARPAYEAEDILCIFKERMRGPSGSA